MKKSMIILLIVLSLLALLFLANLTIGILFPELYCYAGLIDEETLMDTEKLWAFRGQIGDILAGHFTALSLFALFYSLMLQRESIQQMNLSIDKQSDAIGQQSDALLNQQKEISLQNKALTAQVAEMKSQKDEFEANNLINRFHRHFKRIDELEDNVTFDYLKGMTHVTGFGIRELREESRQLSEIHEDILQQLSSILYHCIFVANQLDNISDTVEVSRELKIQFRLKLRQMHFDELINIYIIKIISHASEYQIDTIVESLLEHGDTKIIKSKLVETLTTISKKVNIETSPKTWQYIMNNQGLLSVLVPSVYKYFTLKNQ